MSLRANNTSAAAYFAGTGGGVPASLDFPLGATFLGDGKTAFNVWAPKATALDVVLVSQQNRTVRLEPADGYHRAAISGVSPGDRYLLRLPDGRMLPDPASRFQPEGVHKPSEVIDPAFAWTDSAWRGTALADYIVYELHVGTFSPEGTFDGVVKQLDALADLGITAIELMPVAQFPGGRNWGYDGVHPFAVQNTYGGPTGLKRLVDTAHARGIAVVLDVVYNHLGPEGNYLNEFGHYFTDRYHTPWGSAINFDGPESDDVRRYFIDNALEWVTAYHVDALRIDAIQAIVDESARPFLMELAAAVRSRAAELNRRIFTIAESNLNNPRHVTPVDRGGFGLDAQWNDDFEHALRVALTGQADGYYCDFVGLDKLAKAYREGFVLDGGYSNFFRRRYGAPARNIRADQLLVFAQNHDQVGNRPCGERLCHVIDFEATKLATAALLLAPYVPLLFMGEEYGETAPFQYFVSHTDPALLEAVRKGRRGEFVDFIWPDDWPDPCAPETFERSRLNLTLREHGRHAVLWNLYRELIRLRKTVPALRHLSKESTNVTLADTNQTIVLYRRHEKSQACIVLNFSDELQTLMLELPDGSWRKALDTSDPRWHGPGSQIPDEFFSSGNLSLPLPAHAACLLVLG